MAYDKGLAQRLREHFQPYHEVGEIMMFGGLCFTISRHMCCGIVGDTLMARVGPDRYDECLELDFVREMDFTGRAMRGMVYVAPGGIEEEADLAWWVMICAEYAMSLPPKTSA